MRTFSTALPLSMVVLFVATTVHAQTNPVGATTVSSAAPLQSAPPPSESPSQTTPADTASPLPAPPPASSAANEPAPPPPTPAAPAVAQQHPAPTPAPSSPSTPGPSIWGPAAKPQPYIQRWYGWQTLIAVASADSLMAIDLLSGSEAGYTLLVGVPVHIMAGPFNHWVHGNTGKGFAALGMNLAPPVVGYLAGGVVGILPGLFVGPIIDIALLSTRSDRVRHESAQRPPAFMPSSIAIVPMIDANRKGISIIGQF